VWRREGRIRHHAELSEFLHPTHDKVILLDGNLLASSESYRILRELTTRGVKVNFNQGLDIRLMTEEIAEQLAKIDYRNWRFTSRLLHFAFDDPSIEKDVVRGIGLLKNAGILGRHQVFYMLCGFNTTFDQDYHRFEVLKENGVLPFIMIYNNGDSDPIVRHFARWVNKRYYKFVPWEKYDHGDSQQVIGAMK
jgi:hypothetical protein